MVTAQRAYTLADLPELPDDDRIYDILGGKLVVRNVPDDNHAELLTSLFGPLYTAQEASYGRVFTSTRAVALDFPRRGDAAEDVTHPDLFFVREERAEPLRGPRAFQGVPDLVIEILSRTTRDEHRPCGDLWRAYERNGLPHYWLVDPVRRTISQHTLIGETYVGGRYERPDVLREGDILTSPLFPSISAPIGRVFRHVRDRE